MKILKLLVAGTILAASSMSMAATLGEVTGTFTSQDVNKGNPVTFTITEVSEGVWHDTSSIRETVIVRDDEFMSMLMGKNNTIGTFSGTEGDMGEMHNGVMLPKAEITLRGELITYENGDMRILWINADGTTLLGPVLVFHDSDYNWNGTDAEVRPTKK